MLNWFSGSARYVVPGVLVCAGGWLAPSDSHAQKLEVLLQSALDTNPKVASARSSARAVGYEIDQAEAAWSPRLGVVADPGRTLRIGDAGSRSSSAGDIAPRATKLIFDGGRSDAEIERQKARQQAAALRVYSTSEQLLNQVCDLYLEAIKQSRLAEAAASNVAAHEDLVGRVSEIVKVDAGRRSDLVQAQARLEQARVQQQQRQAAMLEARAQVAAIVNAPLTDVMPVQSAAGALPASQDAALALLENHPAVLAARADADAAKQQAVVADAWNKPRVDLQSTLQRDASFASGHYGKVVDLRFVANWTGYDGGAGRAAASAAQEQAMAAIDTSQGLKRDLSVDVTRNWTAISTRSARLSIWLQLEKQLAEVKGGYWEQFKIGRRSILDLLNVESEIFQARSSYESDRAEIEQSQYRLLGATAQLANFLGLRIAPVPVGASR